MSKSIKLKNDTYIDSSCVVKGHLPLSTYLENVIVEFHSNTITLYDYRSSDFIPFTITIPKGYTAFFSFADTQGQIAAANGFQATMVYGGIIVGDDRSHTVYITVNFPKPPNSNVNCRLNYIGIRNGTNV